jgi:NAD(P)H-hydrate epimerase
MVIEFPAAPGDLPLLTTAQMREVDRRMVEDYGIDLARMMENAGRGLAIVARDRFLDGDAAGRRVVVLAGRGNNGGGGLVCARRLHGWGARVTVVLSRAPERFEGVAAQQLRMVRRLGIEVCAGAADRVSPGAELVVDALIGYSLAGGASGIDAELITAANAGAAPVLSLDTPSGVDAATGEAPGVAIAATATVTLALPKAGLARARDRVGELYLADIGVPPTLYTEAFGLATGPIFSRSDILRVW